MSFGLFAFDSFPLAVGHAWPTSKLVPIWHALKGICIVIRVEEGPEHTENSFLSAGMHVLRLSVRSERVSHRRHTVTTVASYESSQ